MEESTTETIDKMDWWCTQCGGDGEIPFPGGPNHNQPTYVVCSHCSHPSAYGWCEKCGVGTQLEWVDIRKKPKSWECDNCKTEYRFPVFFYENPLIFYPEAFSDIQKIRENQFIREYGHVYVVGIQRVLLFWRKKGIIPFLIAVAVFALTGIWGVIFNPPSSFVGFILLFSLALLVLMFLLDAIAWLTSKIFLILYRIRKKQGRP
jgi:hypothetical protein